MNTGDLPTVGLIGIGLMGGGMGRNLLKGGYRLLAVGHRNQRSINALVDAGAKEVATPAELGNQCDIIFLCLPSSREVETVVVGSNGLLSGARPGLIVVDSSTADPQSSLAIYERCKEKAVRFADAPLGGTPAEAINGTLTAMVGADKELFEEIEPVCKAWASRVIRLGGVSLGHKMKLLNNFLSLSYGALYSEALAIACKSGVPIDVFDSVIRGGRMDCGFYQTFMQYVLTEDKEAHRFSLANAHKDILYLNAMADDAGVATQIGAAVKNIYTYAVNRKAGEEFVPALAHLIADANAA